MPEASQNKKELEAGARTFGIEVEFATHNYELLSFTHIEVCYLYPEGMPMERLQTDAWKIETDANYTFELVSPILSFDDRDKAELFKSKLLQKLQDFVSNVSSNEHRRLEIVLDKLKHFLTETLSYIPYASGVKGGWSERSGQEERIKLGFLFTSKDELVKKINWENWDEDTDLKVVLDEKRRIIDEDNDETLAFKLANILLFPSGKNFYLCDSQMNVPQTLEEYVTYQAKHKLIKAIKRREEGVNEVKEYASTLLQSAPECLDFYSREDNMVSRCYKSQVISSYNEYRLEEQRSKANKYFAWLRVFSHVTKKVVKKMCEKGILVSGELRKEVPSEVLTCTNGERYEIFQVWSKPLYQMIYVIVQKLVYGTLGQLSETPQMRAQEEIMRLAELSTGEKFAGVLLKDKNGSTFEPNLFDLSDYKSKYPFLDYYSYVKDLTPLWFKAPLLDVIAEGGEDDRKMILRLFLCKELMITDLIAQLMKVTKDKIRIRDKNFSMLDVEESEDEDAIEETFFQTMRQTEVALRHYLTTRNGKSTTKLNLDTLTERLEANDMVYIAMTEDVKDIHLTQGGKKADITIEFLKRNYSVHYDAQKSPVTVSIAPWEARWDTLKGPLRLPVSLGATGGGAVSGSSGGDLSQVYYLVEHRNN